MRLPYERFDQILLIAASRDVMNNIVIPSQNLELDFREYVSSQLHLNVTTDLFGREMQEYYRAYLFLRGDPNFQKDAIQVLKYFYSDVAMFLENNPCDVRVQVTVPECMHRLCGTAVVRVEELFTELNKLLSEIEGCEGNYERIEEVVRTSSCSVIFDAVPDPKLISAKQHSYVVLIILKQVLAQPKLKALKQEV